MPFLPNVNPDIHVQNSHASTGGRQRAERSTPRQSISQDLRNRFVQQVLSGSGTSVASIARTFGLPISTAHAMLRRQEATGATTPTKRGGARATKITPNAQLAVEQWIGERPDLTLKVLCERLAEELAITISRQSMAKLLTKIGFTCKLTRPVPIQRNCPGTILARKEYARRFLSDSPPDSKNIVWVDECGFNLHLRRKFGRARRGTRASIVVANSHGRNISVCAAMSEEGFLHEQLRPGAYSAEHFCSFLVELFEVLRREERSHCWIVLDNVRFHHCATVATCAAHSGHLLVFLPPYSPMLNPIESLFGKWKTLIRTQGVALTQDSLLEHMATTRAEITRDDCLGWIREVGRNLALCFENHEFQ